MRPTHETVPEGHELEARERFGENISELVAGGDVLDADCIGYNVGAKVV